MEKSAVGLVPNGSVPGTLVAQDLSAAGYSPGTSGPQSVNSQSALKTATPQILSFETNPTDTAGKKTIGSKVDEEMDAGWRLIDGGEENRKGAGIVLQRCLPEGSASIGKVSLFQTSTSILQTDLCLCFLIGFLILLTSSTLDQNSSLVCGAN